MRPDVKLGVVLSVVLVLVAGGYYIYRDGQEQPIALSDQATGATAAKSADKGPADEVPTAGRSTREAATPVATKGSGAAQADQDASSSSPAATRRPTRTVSSPRPASTEGETARSSNVPVSPPTSGKVASPSVSSSDVSADRPVTSPVGDTRTATESRPGTGSPPLTRTDVATGVSSASPSVGPEPRNESSTSGPTTPTRVADAGGASAVPAPAGTTRAGSEAASTRPSAGVAVETHRVQPGDTLSNLAVAYYGSERFVEHLIRSNPQLKDPDRLQVGATVQLPPASAIETSRASQPTSPPRAQPTRAAATKEHGRGGRTYVVQPGDSFYAIARDVLGDSARWEELFALNQTVVKGDPRRLQVGQVLTLPGT